MKNWKRATDQTETSKTQFKNGAVIPVSQSEAARLAAREKALSQYYDRRLFPACESLHPRYGNAGGRIFYRER